MRLDEMDAELLATNSLVLGTIGPDGRPQLVAMWFVVADGRVLMSSVAATQKVRNLERDPGCSMLLFHPETPYYYAEIRGEASLAPDPAYEVADRIGPRYGADFRSYDGPDTERVAISVRPSKILVIDAR